MELEMGVQASTQILIAAPSIETLNARSFSTLHP